MLTNNIISFEQLGPGFETHWHQVMSFSKSHDLPIVPKKQWLHPQVTEKLLTGTWNCKQISFEIDCW